MWKLTLHMHCTWVAEYTWTLLNIISQILCIQQDNLCHHTSHVTCTLMSISNSDILNTNQLSSLVHTKPLPWKKRATTACPNNDCERHFILEWLGKHLLTVHHISLYVKCHSDNGHRQSINSPRTQHRIKNPATSWQTVNYIDHCYFMPSQFCYIRCETGHSSTKTILIQHTEVC